MLWRLTLRSFRDGLPDLSNFYCHPGRAGGSPTMNYPSGAVQLGDDHGVELKVVGEEDEAQFFLAIEVVNAPQGAGVKLR